MQSVFNAIIIFLFICINRIVNTATIWPGLFAQSVLHTPPVFWAPITYYNSPEISTANLQQSESHLLGSADHHMISSDEPLPSGLFIPVNELHRELFNSPHHLRKHSSNHYPSYHQFDLNHYPSHLKKIHPSNKNHISSKFKSNNRHFLNQKKQHHHSEDEFTNEKFNYLDNDDFYARNLDLFKFNNFNKITNNFLGEYGDFTSPERPKNWKIRSSDQINAFIGEGHLDANEDDLFTIKNNDQFAFLKQKSQMNNKNQNGRIDLRKMNKKNQSKDHFNGLREYKDSKEIREYKEFIDPKELLNKDAKDEKKLKNENKYINYYDNRSNGNNEGSNSSIDDKFKDNRNIENHKFENIFNNKMFNQLIPDDGRILINKNSENQTNMDDKFVFTNFTNPNGELSVISKTIYQNHYQPKNDNQREPSRLVLIQNFDRQFEPVNIKNQDNESITIATNNLSSSNNRTASQQFIDHSQNDLTKLSNRDKFDSSENQINKQIYTTTDWNAQRIIPTPQISFMQSMLTESNTISTNDQSTKSTNYLSERSQLNRNNNHFGTLAISAIIIASLIAALLFTGSSLFLMYKVSQIKKRRLMRFQETANRNQFEVVFPMQDTTNCNASTSSQISSSKSLESNAALSSNIISNNNFIRQQKSLFSNLNSRCNAGKSMLQIDSNSNFTIKPSEMATINKKVGKHLNLANVECYVNKAKTSGNEKSSALGKLLSKVTNQADETDSIKTDQKTTNQSQHIQKVRFF